MGKEDPGVAPGEYMGEIGKPERVEPAIQVPVIGERVIRKTYHCDRCNTFITMTVVNTEGNARKQLEYMEYKLRICDVCHGERTTK